MLMIVPVFDDFVFILGAIAMLMFTIRFVLTRARINIDKILFRVRQLEFDLRIHERILKQILAISNIPNKFHNI